MRVATLNRDMETSHFGGDIVHVKTLTKYLEGKGIRVELNPPHHRLDEFDIVHCWHLNFGFSKYNLDNALRMGAKIVLTTIYYEDEMESGTSFREQLGYLEKVNRVVSYSLPEANGIRQCTGFNGSIEVIPPGVEKMFHAPDGGDRVEEIFAATARLGEKNTNKIEAICYNLNQQFHMLEGKEDREILASHYKKAKIFVQASEIECYGLTILEALASGCRVLATKASKGAQTLPGIMLIDPLDMDNIKFHIERALRLSDQEWNWLPNQMARLMSWEYAAFRYSAIYEELMRH